MDLVFEATGDALNAEKAFLSSFALFPPSRISMTTHEQLTAMKLSIP
jgi:hypothetical protein